MGRGASIIGVRIRARVGEDGLARERRPADQGEKDQMAIAITLGHETPRFRRRCPGADLTRELRPITARVLGSEKFLSELLQFIMRSAAAPFV
jgi:hypothetical protein